MTRKSNLARFDTPLLRMTLEDWFGFTEGYELLDHVGVLSGRDCDTTVLLVRMPDGTERLVYEDPCLGTGPEADILAELRRRPGAYRRAADETEAFISRAVQRLALNIIEAAPDVPPDPGDEMPGADSLLQQASAKAKAKYGDGARVVCVLPLLWYASGWEMDSPAVLVQTPDGLRLAFMLDPVPGPGDRNVDELLRERLRAYRLAALEMERFLVKSQGHPKPAALPARPSILSTPDILSGAACIEGTGVPAATILSEIVLGMPEAEIMRRYPSLPPRACDAVFSWAAERIGRWMPTAGPTDDGSGAGRQWKSLAAPGYHKSAVIRPRLGRRLAAATTH